MMIRNQVFMKRKKSMLLSTGIVGLSAMALTATPAMAAGNVVDIESKQSVEVGTEVNLNKDELTALGLPSGSFKVVTGEEGLKTDSVKVEEVLDDADVVKGSKTTATVDKEGVWVFLTDAKGNLTSVDFKPAEGFKGDPSVNYALDTNVQSTKADDSAENVEELADRPVVELLEVNNDKAEVVENSETVEKKEFTTGKIVLDYPDVEEKVEEKVDEKETTKDAVKPETKPEEIKAEVTVEDKVEGEKVEDSSNDKVEKVQLRTFAAAPAAPAAPVTTGAAAGAAPAAPGDQEELPEAFPVPDLKKTGNASGPVSVKFGTDGKGLPSGVDKDSLKLLVPAGDNDSVVFNNGKAVQTPLVGEWKVNGNEGFTFEPYDGFSEKSVTMEYTVTKGGDFSERGTVTINFEKGSADKDESSDTPSKAGNGSDSKPGKTDSKDNSTSNDVTLDVNDKPGEGSDGTSPDGTSPNGTPTEDTNGDGVIDNRDEVTENGNGSGDNTDPNGDADGDGVLNKDDTDYQAPPSALETGGEMLNANQSVLYAAAAGIAGLIATGFFFLARIPAKKD